ncbi:Cytochrome P450 94A1 [Rhizoctonia solani AG-1 IB]|uniref:Cytochrome P450 94A1 n=1 Tax=Thanatephorus cucumeris (strain AG1-IB / isolate 7/3/14) TaxID=1108050 RepID=M5CDC0_THACB|nr:Cytochrome P450 94A1 [Rhizoctonia solani AG-1 IB]
MSQTLFASNSSQALNTVIDFLQAHPLESSVALAATSLGGYILRHMVSPAQYHNIDGPPRKSITFGHLFDIYSPEGIPFHDELQDKYGSVCKVNGMLGMLNPVFTAKHMKSLVTVFDAIAQNMKKSMIKDIGDTPGREIDVLKWCSATALELIGQAGLGHTFGVLEGIESPYSLAVKDFLPAVTKVLPLQAFFPFFYSLRPTALQRKLAEWAPITSVRRIKEIVDVQDEQAQIILEQKKNGLTSGQADITTGEESHDIMSVLLKANMEADEKDRLPEDQLLGQMNGALARILQLLAMDESIQNRLRTELLEAPAQLTYDDIHNLPYLDAICRETLRLYPPAPILEREAMMDCTVPLRYPIKGKNGEEIREIRVQKGTIIYVSLKEANRSKETWGQDADVFRPERWLEKLPESVSEAKTSGVYSSMMTFSAGPRACM